MCSSRKKNRPNVDIFRSPLAAGATALNSWRHFTENEGKGFRVEFGIAEKGRVLGEALGQKFVEVTFTPESKARMLKLVDALEKSLDEDIHNLSWMSDETKRQAKVKLEAIRNKIGYPESSLILSQCAIYLASSPKSNAATTAIGAAMSAVKQHGDLPVPLHIRNAPTRLMKELGYGSGYRYAHDEPDAYAAGENYFPDELKGRSYYHPVPRGLEIRIGEALARLRASLAAKAPDDKDRT